MISTERAILIKKGEAIINDPIILYRGDYQVKILFTILEHKFKFKETLNIIEQTRATYAQLAISLPDSTDLFTDIIKTENGTVIFEISKSMIDEISEVGSYSFHIRLFNEDRTSRVTLPPINGGIVIREPLIAEDRHPSSSIEVGYSKVDEAKITSDVESFADASGNLKIVWNKGDIISSTRLNEMVRYINENAVPGADGLTTSITVNGETYRQLNGNITLPNYPKTSEGGGNQDVDLSAYATTDYVNKEVAKKADINHTHNYLTNIPSEYITETELNEKGYITEAKLNDKGYLTNIPSEYITETELNNKGYLTDIPSEYITETELNRKGYLTEHQDISNKANISDLATVAMSGNYDDLTNKPSIPSLDGYATKQYVDDEIEKINDNIANVDIEEKVLNGNTLTLGSEPYQNANIVNETRIVLPSVNKYTEIHLFFTTTSEITIIMPSGLSYQKAPIINANKVYEFIFTYVNTNIGWVFGYVEYSE